MHFPVLCTSCSFTSQIKFIYDIKWMVKNGYVMIFKMIGCSWTVFGLSIIYFISYSNNLIVNTYFILFIFDKHSQIHFYWYIWGSHFMASPSGVPFIMWVAQKWGSWIPFNRKSVKPWKKKNNNLSKYKLHNLYNCRMKESLTKEC